MKNEVKIIGRFIKTPTPRVSKRGNPYTTFVIASQRDSKTLSVNIDYIRCVAFGNTSKIITGSSVAGDLVQIEGCLTTNGYTNSTGERVYSWNVRVDKISHVDTNYTIAPFKGDTNRDEDNTPADGGFAAYAEEHLKRNRRIKMWDTFNLPY